MEEIMKNSWLYIGGGIAFVITAGYFIYKRIGGDPIDPTNPIGCIPKKHIESLSYEFIIEEAKNMVSELDEEVVNDDSVLNLAVIPNKLALQFISLPNSKKWLKNTELTEEEKQNMVILSIKDREKELLSEILIANKVMDDYYDFVSEDKIYIKKITVRK